MNAERYFLKPGYESREEPLYFEDPDVPINYQPEVYTLARAMAPAFGCRRIIDLGCGRATKLVKLHPELEIVGVDIGPNIEGCRARYGFGTWIEFDLESERLPEGLDASGAILVAADVIEHLRRPERMLAHIRTLLEQAPFALVSTPERDLIHGPDHVGPPRNRCHVREWNREEFSSLLSHAGLRHVIGLTPTQDRVRVCKTILAIVEGAGRS